MFFLVEIVSNNCQFSDGKQSMCCPAHFLPATRKPDLRHGNVKDAHMPIIFLGSSSNAAAFDSGQIIIATDNQ